MRLPFRMAGPGLLTLALLAACGTPETLVFESGPIPLTAEGPLFEGSNTAQGQWQPGLEAFLKEHGATVDQVKGARVTGALLEADSTGGLDGIRSVSLSIASDASDMVQVGVINPLLPGQQQAKLTTAGEQKGLVVHLLQPAVTVVADLDLDADSDADRHVTGSLFIELQLKR